jgi:hypothetical protein
MRTGKQRIILLFACIILAGCGDTAAQKLAADTAAITAGYEKQVKDKVNAENAFYATQRQNLIESLAGYRPSYNGTLPATPDVKESIYYLSIKTNAQRDALIAADNIATGKSEKILTPTIEYVDNGVTEEQQLYASLSTREGELNTQLTQGIKPLDEQTNRLATVRSQLVSLSQPLSEWDQLQQAINVGKGTQKIIQNKGN